MARKSDTQTPGEGIVVYCDLDTLRKGVERVLVEFHEFMTTPEGEQRPVSAPIHLGDTVIFKEDIDLMPTEIVATNIGKDTWFVICTSEHPPSGFPTGKDASRAAESELKKLRILKDYLNRVKGVSIKSPTEWRPDQIADAKRVLQIMNDTVRRFHH